MSWWQRVLGREEGPLEPQVVLVVDDDRKIHSQVKSALSDFGWEFAFADDKTATMAILERQPRLVTALVDLYFPEDKEQSTGLEIIGEVRRRYPHIRCAALSGGLRQNHINEVGKLDATYIAKWDIARTLTDFGTKILIANATPDEPLRRSISAYADHFRLSPRETELVALAAADVPRALLPKHTGVKNSTVKTQIRAILDKTKAKSIEAIGRTLRLQARDAARPKANSRVKASYDGPTDTWTIEQIPIAPDDGDPVRAEPA